MKEKRRDNYTAEDYAVIFTVFYGYRLLLNTLKNLSLHPSCLSCIRPESHGSKV